MVSARVEEDVSGVDGCAHAESAGCSAAGLPGTWKERSRKSMP